MADKQRMMAISIIDALVTPDTKMCAIFSSQAQLNQFLNRYLPYFIGAGMKWSSSRSRLEHNTSYADMKVIHTNIVDSLRGIGWDKIEEDRINAINDDAWNDLAHHKPGLMRPKQ